MKYYFSKADPERCYNRAYFEDLMYDEELTEIEVFEAKPGNIDGYIWCSFVDEVGDKSECNKNCPDYKPKNGKNGICSHRGKLYSEGKKVTLVLNSRKAQK